MFEAKQFNKYWNIFKAKVKHVENMHFKDIQISKMHELQYKDLYEAQNI